MTPMTNRSPYIITLWARLDTQSTKFQNLNMNNCFSHKPQIILLEDIIKTGEDSKNIRIAL